MAPPPPPQSSSEPVPYGPVKIKINPSILLIIVIVAVIFFVSGLLHLLVRYLLRPTILLITKGDSEEYLDDSIDVYNVVAWAIQGQLQQLFHLHDAGVDQSFIDALLIFPYSSIVGSRRRTQLKDPFDCAVCLCEFDPDHNLRLLPNCSHAFHTHCIDTWLLTHSTCPLCRTTLLSSPSHCTSSMVRDSFREIAGGVDEMETRRRSRSDGEEMEVNLEEIRRVVHQVKLGKFRSSSVDDNIGGGSNLDYQRRCFSMGSYEYEVNDNNPLRVAIKPSSTMKKWDHDGSRTRTLAMSECDCHSTRELGSRGIISNKFWLRSKKHDPVSAAAKTSSSDAPGYRTRPRAFSIRLHALSSETKAKSAVLEEYDVSSKWEKNGSENMDLDVEVGNCNNIVLSMGLRLKGCRHLQGGHCCGLWVGRTEWDL